MCIFPFIKVYMHLYIIYLYKYIRFATVTFGNYIHFQETFTWLSEMSEKEQAVTYSNVSVPQYADYNLLRIKV